MRKTGNTYGLLCFQNDKSRFSLYARERRLFITHKKLRKFARVSKASMLCRPRCKIRLMIPSL